MPLNPVGTMTRRHSHNVSGLPQYGILEYRYIWMHDVPETDIDGSQHRGLSPAWTSGPLAFSTRRKTYLHGNSSSDQQ